MGDGPILHPAGLPSKQSTTALRYALPAGMRNSVMSVTHSSSGAGAEKSRATRLGGAADTSPA